MQDQLLYLFSEVSIGCSVPVSGRFLCSSAGRHDHEIVCLVEYLICELGTLLDTQLSVPLPTKEHLEELEGRFVYLLRFERSRRPHQPHLLHYHSLPSFFFPVSRSVFIRLFGITIKLFITELLLRIFQFVSKVAYITSIIEWASFHPVG